MACETDAYGSASLQHCDFTMYLPVWTFDTFESQSFCSGSRQLATHCGTVLTSWRSSWVSQLTSIHRRGFIRQVTVYGAVCSMRDIQIFLTSFLSSIIYSCVSHWISTNFDHRPKRFVYCNLGPMWCCAGTPSSSFQVWRFAWKFAGTDVNQARCFRISEIGSMSIGISVQHSVASFLSTFPSSYQLIIMGTWDIVVSICLRVDSLQWSRIWIAQKCQDGEVAWKHPGKAWTPWETAIFLRFANWWLET